MNISQVRFTELAQAVIDALPDDFRLRLDNIAILIEDRPSRRQLADADLDADETLLGLYEGIPLTERTADYGLVLPDRVTLFRLALLDCCADEAELAEEIRITLLHELAHHFGIDDERLVELGAY